ncbi:hypothetical protein VPH35_039422 [Triticum aestivum]|uniref:uncharacterized protein n=1 Tax=Triticum aestivum TaxID=4565 RepID=UPI001D00CB96|nr:uncharacterized protein LOC123049870 [Triticum aestivum]
MTIDPYDQLFAADEGLDRSRVPDPLEELFAEDEPLARLYIDDCFQPTGDSSPSPPTSPRAPPPPPADAPAPVGFVNDDVGRIACPRASRGTDAGRRWFPISQAPAGSPRRMSRPASVFTDSDPTRGRNELAPPSPPRDALPLHLASLLPPGWGRPGCGRCTTTAPTEVQPGCLVRDEGPLQHESSEHYVWRRFCDVSVEFERLWSIYCSDQTSNVLCCCAPVSSLDQ